MRIGEAAELVGLATHVLRHWEDEGVVVPARNEAGHRIYDAETVSRLRLVLGCQSAGMSLPQIRLVLNSGEPGRDHVIREQRRRVSAQVRELRQTRRFLDHVIDCRHSLVSRCSECSRYADRHPANGSRS